MKKIMYGMMAGVIGIGLWMASAAIGGEKDQAPGERFMEWWTQMDALESQAKTAQVAKDYKAFSEVTRQTLTLFHEMRNYLEEREAIVRDRSEKEARMSAIPVKTESGLEYIDLVEGSGQEAKAGQEVSVHYTGWLKNGKKFDSSLDRGKPFNFPLGGGRVIKGWDEGVAGMKIGGKRTLFIPSNLGYGERGAGDAIPPNAELRFEVELLGVSGGKR